MTDSNIQILFGQMTPIASRAGMVQQQGPLPIVGTTWEQHAQSDNESGKDNAILAFGKPNTGLLGPIYQKRRKNKHQQRTHIFDYCAIDHEQTIEEGNSNFIICGFLGPNIISYQLPIFHTFSKKYPLPKYRQDRIQ